MDILRHILPILPAVLLTGCFEDFDPNVDSTPTLCLNSLIKAGEPIEVEVTHTWTFNDMAAAQNHEVTDAKVIIFANGDIVGSDYIPKEGDIIGITAESPEYGKATAEVTVPYATPIGKVKATPSLTSIYEGNEDASRYEMLVDIMFNLSIEMDVNDPAGVDNYYHFGYGKYFGMTDDNENDRFEVPWPDSFSLGKFEYNSEPIFKEHIGVFETVMGNDEGSDFVFFSDSQFPGKTYTLHLNFTDNRFSLKSVKYDESLLEWGVVLYLTTVSKSYYNWAVYKWNVDEGISGELSDIGMAEPKWGYSNVSTGAGVVAAQSTSSVVIDLKDFFKTILRQ